MFIFIVKKLIVILKMKKSIYRHIPNILTILNLFSGCIAIVLSFEDYLLLAVYFIFIAAILDYFDGFAARLLKTITETGKELDSLADMVSFGIAPSVIMYHLLKMSLVYRNPSFSFESINFVEVIILFSAFLIAVFSGIRLAKFNLDKQQNNSFIGLPSPANAILIASITFILLSTENENFQKIILNIYVLLPLILFLSILLIAKFPMFSLKFKNLSFKGNKIRYIFLGISAILLILLQTIAIPIIVFFYILLSAVNNWIFKIN